MKMNQIYFKFLQIDFKIKAIELIGFLMKKEINQNHEKKKLKQYRKVKHQEIKDLLQIMQLQLVINNSKKFRNFSIILKYYKASEISKADLLARHSMKYSLKL